MDSSHPDKTDIIRHIPPTALQAYAKANGWQQTAGYGNYSNVYSRDQGPDIIIPHTDAIDDYALAVSDLIVIFAATMGTTPEEILSQLTNTGTPDQTSPPQTRMVRRLGRNLSLNLPPALAAQLGITPGSEIYITIENNAMVLTPNQPPQHPAQ